MPGLCLVERSGAAASGARLVAAQLLVHLGGLGACFVRGLRQFERLGRRALASGLLEGDAADGELDLSKQLRLDRECTLTAELAAERTPGREVLDVVAELGDGAGRISAALPTREEPQVVFGLERCPQSALVVREGVRELQEEGLSAWKTAKTNSEALPAGTRPVLLSRISSRMRR